MNAPFNVLQHFPRAIRGMAAVLTMSIAVGCVAILFDAQGSRLAAAELPQYRQTPALRQSTVHPRRCAECGVIESIRSAGIAPASNTPGIHRTAAAGERSGADPQGTRHYTIIVRMTDGSRRIIADTQPGTWREGDRVGLIAGLDK